MSPIIYAYVLLFTALVALAAAAIEWGVQGRIPARYLWSAAMWIALLAPPAALAWHVGSNSDRSESGAVSSRVLAITVNAAKTTARRGTASSDAPIHSLITHRPNWRAEAGRVSGKLSPALLVLWIGGSVAFMIWLVAGALHWRRARRTWHAAVMDGVEVDVSPATGPAVLGIISHRIVMPEWAMSMASEQQRLMLAHEREHVSARDPQRLALAVVALILMPWNAVLWWCTARLRRAIEMDCDARVLRQYPCAKEYGRLLLDVAARGHGFESVGIPAVALLRLPSELETRLCAISRGRYVGKRTLAVGGMIAVVAIVTAFATPVPRMQLVSGVRQTGVEIPPLTRRMTRLIVIPYRKPVLVIDPVSTDTGARWRTDSLRSLAQRNDSLALIARQLARKARTKCCKSGSRLD